MESFASIANQVEKDFSADQGTSQETNTDNSSSEALSTQRADAVEKAIAELDKMERFKFDGQEYTPKDLKSAILRQKDYTQKTQSLSTERKSFEDETKFYSNLAWDLIQLRNNPSLVDKFLSIYPQKFHKYADEFLNEQRATQGNQQSQTQAPQVPVQLLSRIDVLEKTFREQEVAKNEAQIQTVMNDMAKKYPDAANFKEMVLGRAFEANSQGTNLTTEAWENIYKQVDGEVGQLLKAKYGSMVKKQQEANAKAKDVASGGGTPATAPKRFTKLSDVTKHAIEDLTRNR